VTDLTDAQEALQERIAYRGFATVASLGRVLPTTTGRVLFRWLGIAAFHLLPTRRAVVAANQAHVLGRPVDDPLVRAATREAFVRYARYWFDAFDVATWTDERVASACSFTSARRCPTARAWSPPCRTWVTGTRSGAPSRSRGSR
jgi:lauroyl/myristoyl acyltransferase